MIAQRLDSVRTADQVLVLDQGRIVDRGTHDELIRARRRLPADLRNSGAHPPDPADGGRAMRKYDPDDLLGKAYDPRIARRLVACAKPYKKQVLMAAAAIIAATAMELLLPILFSRVATVVSDGHGTTRTLNELGLAAIIALVIRSIANWGQLYYTSWLGHYVVFDLRAGLFRHLQWLSIGYVENRRRRVPDDAHPERRRGDQRLF